MNTSAKVGFFALIALIAIGYLTLRVSDFKFYGQGAKIYYVEMNSATGVDYKTPIFISGIQVGTVDRFELTPQNKARLRLKVRNDVILTQDTTAQIKTRGALGDVYLELIPGKSSELVQEGTIHQTKPPTDLSELTGNLNEIAIELKEVTRSIKLYVSGNESSFAKILKNMEVLTHNLAGFSVNNRKDLDRIVVNLRHLTENLNGIARDNSAEINESIDRIRNIVAKIDQGKGSVGRLINDPSTIEKVNDTLDNVNNIVGPASRLQTELGYHMEYLGSSRQAKNYVSLSIKPRPDKYFLFEVVTDPNPPPTQTITKTDVTSGGVTNTVVTKKEEVQKFRPLFSAQIAKQFHNFTFRGGLIESTGGVGVNYDKGPFGVEFSAFDFGRENRRPHLKALGRMNVTKSVYVLGGVDNFISNENKSNWFLGAGIRLIDEDIKSLIGLFSLKP